MDNVKFGLDTFGDVTLKDNGEVNSVSQTIRVLTILTTDATWENIAELANLIETNRPL